MKSHTVAVAMMAFVSWCPSAWAQGLPDEIATPGSTVAAPSLGDAARVNPGAIGVAPTWSLHFNHVSELRAGDTPFNGDALTFVSPLAFGFGASLGASWVRPEVSPAVLTPGTHIGAYGTLELGLGYTFGRFSTGIRWRLFTETGADPASPVSGLDGATALDLGALWRPSQYIAIGLTARSLTGPRAPTVGLDRVIAAGVAVRPTGTEAFTVGVDGGIPQDGGAFVRAGVRVAVPSIGWVRGEGFYDAELQSWRASLGLDLAWGRWSLGGGGFGGSGGVAGFWADAGVDGNRVRGGIPTEGLIVTIPLASAPTARTLGRLLWRIERLRRDPAVRAVVFAPRDDVGGLANAEELREGFQSLQRAGIKVVCHLTDASGSTYYACAGADRVSVDIAGGVRMAGIRTAQYFLGPMLWDLGVRADFVRIGDWKSAPEELALGGSTEPARAQEELLLTDFFDTLTHGIARGRHVPIERARTWVTGGPYTAHEAMTSDLVDAVGTLESAEQLARSVAGGGTPVTLDDYTPVRSPRWAPGSAVAVVYLDGDMVEGDSFVIPLVGMRFSGDRTIVRAIEAAANNSRVGAIVLRVDTGGGSAVASDLIWRAVEEAARRKPVVASFGRVAASGGYYAASAAREIFADPSCLTGSIGIFYGKVDVARLLTRVDVGVELHRRGEHADMDSMFRPYTEDERTMLARMIGEFYGLFLQRVATGRHRTTGEIDHMGRGHVWSGARAVGLGLVDRAAGLSAAIRRAHTLGRLPDDYDVIELPVEEGGLLHTLSTLVSDDGTTPPLARLGVTDALRGPLSWLATVTMGAGHAMALTDWPMAEP